MKTRRDGQADSPSHRRDRDQGFIIVFCLFILSVLTLSSMYALTMSMTENDILRNQRIHLAETYLAEAGLMKAFEHPETWLIPALLLSPETIGVSLDIDVEDACGKLAGTVRMDARGILDSTAPLVHWIDRYGGAVAYPGAYANDVPALSHTRKTRGRGDSAAALIQRNFAVTVTSPGGHSRIQSGGYKLFPATD